jgi:hypothetical protein
MANHIAQRELAADNSLDGRLNALLGFAGLPDVQLKYHPYVGEWECRWRRSDNREIVATGKTALLAATDCFTAVLAAQSELPEL